MPDGDNDTESVIVFEPANTPTLFIPDDLGMLTAEEPLSQIDRGSRAETVTYGGGLRATSRRIGISVLIAALLIAAVGYVVYLINTQSNDRYSAVIVPANVRDLDFTATAPLEKLFVEPGERVHVGEILAEQSNPSLAIAVALSQVTLAAEKQKLSYLSATRSATASSPRGLQASALTEEILQTEDAIVETRLQLALNESRLSLSILRAPINGVVLRTAGLPGELAGPSGVRDSTISDPAVPASAVFQLFPNAGGATSGTDNSTVPVVSLVSGRRWQVIAEVPETAVDSVKAGTAATFNFDALGGLAVPCIVEQVIPAPVEVSGTVEYDVVLRLVSRLPGGVLPGMSGSVSIG